MPIYEYRCSSCGHEQEVLQKMSDAPLTQCAACGKAALSKLISAAGFQLKGSGWYATDFKGGTKPAKSGEDKGDGKAAGEGAVAEAAKSEGGGDKAKGDSKPKEEAKSAAPAGSAASPAGQ